jgi:hypothetical protein
MELDFTLTTIAVFVIIMLIMFARVSISYESGNNGNNISPDIKKSSGAIKNTIRTNAKTNNTATNDILKYNNNSPRYSAYGLPRKDAYMSKGIRNQIDALRTMIYYDNCQYRLLEEFTDDCPTHPKIKIEARSL